MFTAVDVMAKELQNLRADAIALMGWSNGGGTVLWSLSRDSRARPAGLRASSPSA